MSKMYRFDLIQKTIDVINSSTTYQHIRSSIIYIDLVLKEMKCAFDEQYIDEVSVFLYAQLNSRMEQLGFVSFSQQEA